MASRPGPTYPHQPVAAAGSSSGRPAPPPATWVPPAGFNAAGLATEFHKQLNSGNKKFAIDNLCRPPPQQIELIAQAFRKQYNESLAHYVRDRIGGAGKDLVRVLDGCAQGVMEFDVRTLRDAIVAGLGTDEDILIEILVGRTPDDLRAIKSAYQVAFGRLLDADIHSELSGHFRKLFEILLNTDRRAAIVGPFDAAADAAILYKAGEGRIGTDEDAFIHVLAERPDSHLRNVFAVYERQYGRTIESVVQKEFRGDLENALLVLVGSARDRAGMVADLFETAMQGVGTNSAKLARMTVRHRAPEIRDIIKRTYLQRWRQPLGQRISGQTTGDFRVALLACLGEPGM